MRILAAAVLALTTLIAATATALAQADTNLNVRISLDFENARAADVMKAIASAASMSLEMTDEMPPVTITVTNVRVRTALDAVCETAGCKWVVTEGTPPVLKVGRTRVSPKLEIKSNVSVHLKPALFEQAFRTLASYLSVEIVIEGKLPVKSVTLQVKEGTTSTLLDALCKAAQCTWRIDPEGKRLVISAKEPGR